MQVAGLGLAAGAGRGDVPYAPQMPVAGQQQQMAGPVPRMPAVVPPRMAEPRPQMAAVPRAESGAVRPLGPGAQAAAAGNNDVR